MTKEKSIRGWALLAALLIVALACSPLSGLPDIGGGAEPTGELTVSQTRLSILESFPVQVQLSIEGELPNSCTMISSVSSERIDTTFEVHINTQEQGSDCSAGPVRFQEQVQLDVLGLPAGDYQVVVEGVSQSFTLQTDNFLGTEPAQIESGTDLGQGVSLSIPNTVGGMAQLRSVASQATDDNPMPFNNYPDRLEITFPEYPLVGTFHEPRIVLYPLQATIDMNQVAADEVAALRTLLASPPSTYPDPMPFLPIFNAGSMVQAQELMLANDRVEGFRYLTQFGQALYPVNNRDLFYTFQGVTVDGAYYVMAILPVSHPDLPATGDDYLGMDPNEFFESADTYLEEVELMLSEQPGASFQPELGSLDEMLLSLDLR